MDEIKKLIDSFSLHGLQIWYGYLWDCYWSKDLIPTVNWEPPKGFIPLELKDKIHKYYSLIQMRRDLVSELMKYTLDTFDKKAFNDPFFIPRTGGQMCFGYDKSKTPHLWNSFIRIGYPYWLDAT